MSRNFGFLCEKVSQNPKKEVNSEKKMCDVCHHYKCLTFCPNYKDKASDPHCPVAGCAVCGARIYGGETYRRCGRLAYCACCDALYKRKIIRKYEIKA